MAATETLVCELKGGLFRCKESAAGACVYCGRRFCRRHGVFLAEGEEVCNRKSCVAKREDLARHLAYKDAALVLNRERLCGIEQCGAELKAQCSRCKGYFCLRHVEAREETVVEEGTRVPRMANICGHCWKRRPIWSRT